MKFKQKSGSNTWGWLFVTPVIILFLLFFIIPLGYSAYLSLFKVKLTGMSFIGLENYITLLQSPALRQVAGNTIRYWLIMVPASVTIPLATAILIMELPERKASIFRILFYLPIAVGGIVLISIWTWIFNPDYGVLNYILSLIGVPSRAWLADPDTSLLSVAITYLFLSASPNFTLIYCVAIGGIPKHLIEAAKLAGASGIQIIRFIVIPLLKPSIIYVLLVSTIASVSLWVYPKMLTGGGPLKSSTSFGYWIYETAFVYRRFGMASAQAILMLFLTLGFCVVLWRTTYDA